MPAGPRFLALLFAVATLSLALLPGARAAGPYEIDIGSYKFTGRSEPLVATDRLVDLWARVYRPKTGGLRPWPLLIFLHGNHGTCGRFDPSRGVRVDDRADYTTTGTCPAGYVVTPNHLGYGYLAEELASWGYIVVSINANRGITAGSGVIGDSGLNLMRGRLILRHLALLSQWNRGVGSISPPSTLGFNPVGAMDFTEVGLMGHSRGGEGARAALQQFRDPGSPFASPIGPMNIRSIFEIGPVDGQTSRTLDANGVDSMILLPSCDGDVIDLQGVHVLDRAFATRTDRAQAFRGTIAVWGANHNAYNTEWLTSDSPGCFGATRLFPTSGVSTSQQTTAFGTLVPFFRATVGRTSDRSIAALFDPANTLPAALTAVTRYDRGYLPGPIRSATQALETFSQPTGTSDAGVANTTAGVTVTHRAGSYEHDDVVRVAAVDWTGSPATRHFQVNLNPSGVDVGRFKTFAFRVAVRCFGTICQNPPSASGEVNFTVAMVGAGGALSSQVAMLGRARLSRPVGPAISSGGDPNAFLHSVLYTVEIPTEEFTGVDLANVRGVRFVFQSQAAGRIDLGMLTLSMYEAGSSAVPDAAASPQLVVSGAPASDVVASPTAGEDGNTIRVLRGADSVAAVGGQPAAVSIVLTSRRPFPITGALPSLTVGGVTLKGGDVSANGRTLAVGLTQDQFDRLPNGGDVSLFLQASSPVWRFGPLAK